MRERESDRNGEDSEDEQVASIGRIYFYGPADEEEVEESSQSPVVSQSVRTGPRARKWMKFMLSWFRFAR